MISNSVREFLLGSIRRRLILTIALVHTVLMSVFIWDLNVRQKDLLLAQQNQQAVFFAESLAHSAAVWLISRDIMGLQEIIDAQRAAPDLIYAMALDKNGLVLAHTDKTRIGQYVTDLPSQVKLTVVNDDPDLVDVINPAMLGDNHVGWIRVGVGQETLSQQVASVIKEGIVYTVLAIFIGIFIAAVIGTRLTKKLYSIRSTAEKIKSGDLSERVVIQGIDEVSQLANDFNKMLDVLEKGESDLQNSYESIRKKERLLNETQSIAHLGSWELDLNNKALLCSDEVYRIFGYSSNDAPTSYDFFLDNIQPDDKQIIQKHFPPSPGSELDFNQLEYRIVQKSTGNIRYVRQKCQYVKDDTGKFNQVKGTIQDITSEVEAARKLAENEARLKAILKSGSDGLSIITKEGVLIEANDSFLQERGYDDSWLGKLKVWDWDELHSKEELLDILGKVISSNEATTVETQHRNAQGNKFWVEVCARGVDIMGQRLIFATSRDITERKKAEEERDRLQKQLVQSQKMEAIGHLTGGIAHDFNNVLGIILGYATMIQQLKVESETQAKLDKYAVAIQTAGTRAKELISQMLIFSRLKFGQSADVPLLTIGPVLKEITHLLESSIPKNIDLIVEIDEP
ncbi:MAG: PAS domain S-box protein, partial [Gammaproteobacteria bacterium]|nr:PAS domain S-box protein [Gammaproteobacteria bacterium]